MKRFDINLDLIKVISNSKNVAKIVPANAEC